MKTPICDFVLDYKNRNSIRMHMPGHKGLPLLGMEDIDITEIDGADSLFEASGIIKESEDNATELFGSAKTLYSCEGSSLSIRAMLYLAKLHATKSGRKPLILAGRNAHKTFIMGAALLDIDVEWLTPEKESTYLTFSIHDMKSLEEQIIRHAPTAVYITSPDYLGFISDIKSISEVCHKHGVLLVVDNAHGAYLKFLNESVHPLDLGADMCCDSAHKTLPCLTGGGYLHLSKRLPKYLLERGKDALALFASTSPSYLILQSLDAVNKYIAEGYKEALNNFVTLANKYKEKLIASGIELVGDESLKWTLKTKRLGYTGVDFAKKLEEKNVVCEFADPDYVVLMLSPLMSEEKLSLLCDIILNIERSEPLVCGVAPKLHIPEKSLKISHALYLDSEIVPVCEALGRVLATVNISCPPAVPVAVMGEVIDRDIIDIFNYYGVKECRVVK